MRKLAITLVVLVLCLSTAAAKLEPAKPGADVLEPVRPRNILWFDDMEGDVSQYTTVDFTAVVPPHFHVDTYMAYEGTHSWYCGTFDFGPDGGYGNSWDDRLDLPVLDLSALLYPVLTFAYRHDSEIGYDFTYVQAESNGVFVNLNRGYDGAQPWQYIGVYGFIIASHDSPLRARFRFTSDGAWSDEDGFYVSAGGAFMCDVIKVFDYYDGTTWFFDDVESGGLCTPSTPAAAGDYWHLLDDPNPALSDPHSWWCGDDVTLMVPPNLRNGLYTPTMDFSCVSSCTIHFAAHLAIPIVDNDYCVYYGTCDGANYYSFGAYWGDMGLTGWHSGPYTVGYDVGQLCPGFLVEAPGFLWVMNTTDNGCGPSSAGPAGIMIDDVWMHGDECSPTEKAGWGRIKAMYR